MCDWWGMAKLEIAEDRSMTQQHSAMATRQKLIISFGSFLSHKTFSVLEWWFQMFKYCFKIIAMYLIWHHKAILVAIVISWKNIFISIFLGEFQPIPCGVTTPRLKNTGQDLKLRLELHSIYIYNVYYNVMISSEMMVAAVALSTFEFGSPGLQWEIPVGCVLEQRSDDVLKLKDFPTKVKFSSNLIGVTKPSVCCVCVLCPAKFSLS